MIDQETRAFLDDYKARALARFPLSRITAHFHDEMLGVLPPGHRRGMAGFFVIEALTDDVHAQFVAHRGSHYGGYVVLSKPETWITPDAIAACEAANPGAAPLAWYPQD